MYKVILFGILAAITLNLVKVASTGKINASNQKTEASMHSHKTAARWAFGLMLLLVLLIEIQVRINGGAEFDYIFFLHLACAIPCLICLLLLNFYFNGLRSIHHSWIAYLCFILFTGTTITGVPMIWYRL